MHKLFVTQVYQKQLKFNLTDLKKEIAQIQRADVSGQAWSKENYKNGYTSYGSWDKLHSFSSNFELLEKKIQPHVYKYAQKLDYNLKKNDLKCDTIWINVMPSGSMHSSHIHPQSVISGTYYVSTPQNSSAIKFEDPRLARFMNSPDVKPTASKENIRFYSVNPRAGDLILFESWLKHEVPLNSSKTPRISVSFNYGWA